MDFLQNIAIWTLYSLEIFAQVCIWTVAAMAVLPLIDAYHRTGINGVGCVIKHALSGNHSLDIITRLFAMMYAYIWLHWAQTYIFHGLFVILVLKQIRILGRTAEFVFNMGRNKVIWRIYVFMTDVRVMMTPATAEIREYYVYETLMGIPMRAIRLTHGGEAMFRLVNRKILARKIAKYTDMGWTHNDKVTVYRA